MFQAVFVILALFVLQLPVHSEELLLVDQEGRYCTLEIDNPKEYLIEDIGFGASKKHGQFLGVPRDYFAPLTANEIGDIRHIVTSLANRSLIHLLANRGEFEAAGDRVDHVHPLKFLMVIFTDEELKVCVRNMRGRGWVWGSFASGLTDSLATESSIDNLRIEHIYDFASTVEIDPNMIVPSVEQKKWEEFINLLIEHVPRKGDHGRYDS